MASAMDVDVEEVEMPTSSSSKGEKKRFEVKKVTKHNLTLFVTTRSNNIYIFSGTPWLCGLGVSNKLS